ncbi:MAG: LamG-like jellyroll fold domain-containing protein [Candidatus Cloacimonadaceae bacterium]|nr:LamG-like jellyroll fold domain-containing protein [Candidatus Cloacimonadaceae bacterium]
MGRAMLLISLMVGTIYGGIMLRLQNRMLKLPQMKIVQLIEKEAESVSDFALRTAVRNSVALGVQANAGVLTNLTQRFNNYMIGNCVLDSIEYVFTGTGTQYRALTYVRGNLQGAQISYPAEIAFNFPVSSLIGLPNAFYLEMDQPQFNPSPNFNHVIDTSPNANNGLFYGDVDTRPMGQGVNGWKCASFGPGGGWIEHSGHSTMYVNSYFSVISFAKIREGRLVSTIFWMASDPFDTNVSYTDAGGVFHPGQNLRYKPTAGIWFSGGNMHFSSVNTAYQQATVSVPFVPAGRWPHNEDQWIFFGMSYSNGVLKAYINGALVGTATTALPLPAIQNNYGYSVGRKDIRNLGAGGNSEYMYMLGLLDQVGLYKRTLSDSEMFGIYEDIISPAYLQYVKD